MFDAPTDVELIARHRIRDRARPRPQLPTTTRRTQLATRLRRIADRVEG